MTTRDTFGHNLSRWLREEGEHRVPDHLAEVLMRSAATRQRPWWSSPERWLHLHTVAVGRPLNLRPLAITLLVVSALALAVMAAVWVAGQRPTTFFGLAENGPIIVADDRTLTRYSADGRDVQVLLDPGAAVSGIASSPDGTRLAYRVDDQPARIDVLTIADRSVASITMPPGADVASDQVGWSPDGRMLTFAGVENGVEHVYLAPSSGGTPTVLTGPLSNGRNSRIWNPAYSPDGEWISFVSTLISEQVGSLYLVRPDGSEEHRLDTSIVAVGNANMPAWSPDPAVHRLVFATGNTTLSTRLFDVDTGAEYDAGLEFWPSWSPDGRRIAGCCAQVVTLDDVLAGTPEPTQVFGSFDGYCQEGEHMSGRAVCSRPVWSPDGESLLASDIVGNGILVAPIDGSAPPRRLETGFATNIIDPNFVWQPIRR